MSTPLISIEGKAFVHGPPPSTRFMVRGIALSAANVIHPVKDILANSNHALMANTIIPQLVKLNANCIRVYQVYTSEQHDLSMKALEEAGIYVMVGLATPENSVNRTNGDYSQATFVRAASLVDEFQAYANTLCFSVGNEVVYPGEMAAYINTTYPHYTAKQVAQATIALELTVACAMKSFARDIKTYISTKGYRTIPVGVAMQDGPQNAFGTNNPNVYQQGILGTDTVARYYAAGSAAERMDYIGINSYRYVPGGDPTTAYLGLASEAAALPVPVFLTEAGATSSQTRDWKDVNTMYTVTALGQQLSGEVAFEMLEEGNDFGLYILSSNDTLTPTSYGGAANLGTAFAQALTQLPPAVSATPAGTTSPPAKVTSPGLPPVTVNWLPLLPLKTTAPASASITVSNYATEQVYVVQQGSVVATLQAAPDNQTPVSASVKVVAGVDLLLQGPDWVSVCGVPGAKVKAGITVANNVQWGAGVSCPLV